MAKPFYTMEEVTKLLGKSADEVKSLVQSGDLREFRDGGKLFFKAEDVDKMSGKSQSDSGEISLDAPPIDALGGSDSITLEPIGDDPGESDTSKAKDKEGTVITASGISVFDDDELEIDADPLAKTRIGPGIGDEIPIDGSGSGSGLLDLTREADDTSLGAELLDEIYPGEDEAAPEQKKSAPAEPAAAKQEEEDAEELAEAEEAGEVLATVYRGGADPAEGLFGGLLLGALIILAVSGSVVGGALQGFVPGYGLALADNYLYFVLGSLGVVGVTTVLGWLVGKAGR